MIKRNDVLTHDTIWMNLENMLRNQLQRLYTVEFHLYEFSRADKFTVTESRIAVT